MSTALISNPPYNMKWSLPPFAQIQPRFLGCELPPESNANYAFILSALDLVDSKAVLILPCSVLSGGGKSEKGIRKYLVDKNFIEAVIVCPDKMFEATSIAVCILVLNKNKRTTCIEFVDMRSTYEIECREQRGQFGGSSHENRVYKKEVKVFSEENMKRALDAIKELRDESEFCKAVTIEDVKENDYILNPSRYIEFQEIKSKHREYCDIVADINRIVREKNSCKLTINETLAKSLGFELGLYKAEQDDGGLNNLLKSLGAEPLEKNNYFQATKNKNEIKFENKSKEILSSILIMIMNTWKQHIYYLNQEENRYLVELRDALLPDLMSGEIELNGER